MAPVGREGLKKSSQLERFGKWRSSGREKGTEWGSHHA